jgi:hypothetical protein
MLDVPVPGDARRRPRAAIASWIPGWCLDRQPQLATFNVTNYTYSVKHRPRIHPMRTFVVECFVERTTAHGRKPETQDTNRKPWQDA